MPINDNPADGTESDKEVRAYQVVGKSLLDRIWTGEFRVAGKLPTERDLAESYGVGRAVIRDALVMLEVKGLIQSRQGSGIYITRLAYESRNTPGIMTVPVPAQAAAGAADWETLIVAQQWLESHLAQIASYRMTDTALHQVKTAAEQYATSRDAEGLRKQEIAVHMAIAQAAQNTELTGTVYYLWSRRKDINDLPDSAKVLDVRRKQTAESHQKIIAALQLRDGGSAYHKMWHHFEGLKAAVDTAAFAGQ
ncbi:GntR family transcriptional regulator [Asticcacaulis sp. ZE23SCel15]|uniref:FadR/GntR family transcriptional regulator n=1 Tax=Asticcacaulis sp. ZE23SCel15 TaxID=3059027 RepID=UPI00265E17B0|nr:GntR family transcriptional regulator [Asticcacaulis sp. ZE23SCel15]WKL56086.1 GntR family transcriptional regulator [Asticcacaulis sp. ZE23SCel15]